ncbi:MAG: InlB B-repeat-containing protein [Anaeroplasmataceae bacterium]|nr:InlB B-repeat-containing protein [Anaeroplasmataceae bacterium]
MKKRKFLVSLLCLSALLGVSATALTSCKTDKKEPDTPVVEYWKVTIDLNDGSTPTTKDVVKGQKLTGVPEPTREGYTFAGWKVNGADWTMNTAITGNITIVAQWTAVPAKEYWTVTIDLNDGTEATTRQVEKGQKLTGISEPTREGYTFAGWKANDAAWTMDEAITGNITIVAQWTENTPAVEYWTVTIDLNDGSTPTTKDVVKGQKLTEVNEPTREGYEFAGWKANDAAWTMDEAITANITIVAQWSENPVEYWTVTIDLNDGSTPTTKDVVKGQKLTEVNEPTREGYEFAGWKANDTAWTMDEAITANITIVAQWTLAKVADGKIVMNGTEYATLAAAFAAIPTTSKDTYIITLGKGTYNENGLMYKGSATIRISGSTDAKYGSDVIIKGHGSKMPGETGCDSKNRCLISIQESANIILENLTLESDWYRADHSGDVQAEVLGTDSTGYTAAYNCGFKSHQDTLRTIGKAWFYGCYIEGDVDFIWMEAGGKVALYENCEIVSVYDASANTHNTYITAPKMAETLKLGKGLVIYNSTVKESAEAKAHGQKTYMARTPWSSGCYNQVAYINTVCEGIELSDGPWYKSQIATPFAKTTVGWKMDKATADSIGITGQKDYILDANTVATEFNGRNAILNRVFDTGKLRYVTDTTSNWDINAFITSMGWTVAKDTSSDKLEGDTLGDPVIYNFMVNGENDDLCDGFKFQDGKTHYVGQPGATITIPVNGKCYIEVYGYYTGTAEATADTQTGKMIMFFNNGSTNNEVENDYIIYDEDAKSFVLTAKATTYITKIVVTPDSSIEDKKAETLTIKGLKPQQLVGVPQTLTVEIGPKGVINTSVLWSSSDESIAKVDPYSGKVTFLSEGKVTITATACDGSDVYASVECNPTTPNWTTIEWYTTDTTIATENGATGIESFDVNSSANKKLNKSYSFTNLAGKKISSNYGFKLNSAGKLSFSTIKVAEVFVIVAPQQNSVVNAPSITNGSAKAKLLTSYVDETTGLQYFTYEITSIGTWDIERSDTTVENNPILYVKVECTSDEISESVGVTFKGTNYTSATTGIETIITPESAIDANDSTTQIHKFSLTNCASNGNATNWLTFGTGAKIEFKVDKAATILVGYYSKLQTVKLDGVAVEGDKNSVANGQGEIVKYEISAGGVVTIEGTASDYLGFVGVLFKTLEQKKEDACSNLDKAYPATKYTQNADYETTLAAQKAAINAASNDEALTAAIAAAKTALDALEQDPVVEFAENLNYVFDSLANKPADGQPVESTDVITFTNCVVHTGGQYVALKNDNEVKIR